VLGYNYYNQYSNKLANSPLENFLRESFAISLSTLSYGERLELAGKSNRGRTSSREESCIGSPPRLFQNYSKGLGCLFIVALEAPLSRGEFGKPHGTAAVSGS
jgi:hypothetical protein